MSEQSPESENYIGPEEILLRMIHFESRTGGFDAGNGCEPEEPEALPLDAGDGHVLYERDAEGNWSATFVDGHTSPEDDTDPPVSGRIRTQRAIIGSELFWHGKIMNQKDRDSQMGLRPETDGFEP